MMVHLNRNTIVSILLLNKSLLLLGLPCYQFFFIYIYIYIHTRSHINTHTYIYIYIYINTCVFVSMFLYTHMFWRRKTKLTCKRKWDSLLRYWKSKNIRQANSNWKVLCSCFFSIQFSFLFFSTLEHLPFV